MSLNYVVPFDTGTFVHTTLDQDFYWSKIIFLEQNILVWVCFHIFLVPMTINILGIKYQVLLLTIVFLYQIIKICILTSYSLHIMFLVLGIRYQGLYQTMIFLHDLTLMYNILTSCYLLITYVISLIKIALDRETQLLVYQVLYSIRIFIIHFWRTLNVY